MRRLPSPRRSSAGFTLIELLIAVVIVGVLTAIALPAYNNSIRKSRRSDAVSALTSLQQAQERYRASRPSYAGTLTDLCAPAPPCRSTSPSGYYDVAITTATQTGYVVTATAATGSSQLTDTSCSTMRLQLEGGNIFYGGCDGCAAPGTGSFLSDPNRCWSK